MSPDNKSCWVGEGVTMVSNFLRGGALALLLTTLAGCVGWEHVSTLRVETNIPALTPLAEGAMRAHSDIVCKDALYEERHAQVTAHERGDTARRPQYGRTYSARADAVCVRRW